jgi:hypothetical protein
MKVFGKWDPAEVEVTDPSVKGYMNLAGDHAQVHFSLLVHKPLHA